MAQISQKTPDIPDSSAQNVVRRLAWRYLFVLAAVAFLLVVDQAIVQPMLVRVNEFAPAINVAGRQRMLSQKLTKASLALGEAESIAARDQRLDELQQTLAQWTTEHDALVQGDTQIGIQPIRTHELESQWEELASHYQAMVGAASKVVKNSGDSNSSEDASDSVASIVEHEALYLPTMDRIVQLMENEAAKAVLQLRAFALAITGSVLLLLVGLGWFVVRPATRMIRLQVDELESHVAQRTRELLAALESLRHEVRERESAELKNQRLSSQLAHTERVTTMGHLTAGLAHELNQPLAAITNYAEACDVLLAESPRTSELERVRNFIVQARQAALRAGQIVRRMRNFVRPDAAVTTDVGINALVQEIVELCRPEAANANADIELELRAIDDAVSADPIQIQQVLVNLVQNSLQAMQADGSQSPQITIRTTTLDAFIQVDVSDTGPGFPSADPDVLFTPFHTTKRDGLGIGLSICRSIVELHRGKIWIEALPGRGAQVSFTIPLTAKHASRFRTQPDCLCC